MRSLLIRGLLCGLLVAGPAGAAELSACATADGFDEFDFWVGEWVVHTADGTLAGHNRIEHAEGGCRIDEHWTGAGGGSGSSINFRDPVDGGWEQVWHAPGGVFIRIRGGLEGEDDMLLTGSINYLAQELTAPFRGRWTLLADGRVRQFFEQYDTETEAWQSWFEGFYTRVEAAGEVEDPAP